MFKARQRLGKYRIVRRLASGGSAAVYEALDTIEGIRVALKVPHPHLADAESLALLRREVRLLGTLDHPNVQPIKTADSIDGHFVIVQTLADESLADRLKRRLATDTALDLAQQLLAGLAHAHERRVLHCDVKPENLLLFPGPRLRLTDFGIARVVRRTVEASGSGTVGYAAPEQAMGRPSRRSDVFSAGLVLTRMFSGELPGWPFRWPPAGHARLRARLSSGRLAVLQRALEVDDRRRFRDAGQMLRAWRDGAARGRPKRKSSAPARPDWRAVRRGAFLRGAGKGLGPWSDCRSCGEPVSEPMRHCPWCGVRRERHEGSTPLPARCPRCQRGVKLDWSWCAWCWGARIGPVDDSRTFSDRRYSTSCRACREPLMPFMAWCPWCHVKVDRPSPLPAGGSRCPRCRHGVDRDAFAWCPWCAKSLGGQP